MSWTAAIEVLRLLSESLSIHEKSRVLEVCTDVMVYAPKAFPLSQTIVVNHCKECYYDPDSKDCQKVHYEMSRKAANYKNMKKRYPHYMPIIGDYEKLPLRDECIDVVTIENCPHTQRSTRESLRALKNGGFMVGVHYLAPDGYFHGICIPLTSKNLHRVKLTMELIKELMGKSSKVEIYQKSPF